MPSSATAYERTLSLRSNPRLRVDSSVEPLKCVSETNRIDSKILIDVSFNQQMAMRSARFRQNTQCGQAGSELIHLAFAILTCECTTFISCPCQQCVSSGGLTLIVQTLVPHERYLLHSCSTSSPAKGQTVLTSAPASLFRFALTRLQ